jgi:signal transduction histidine kinase
MDRAASVVEAVLFVIAEALANATQHAGALSIRVHAACRAECVARVEDDGQGFDPGLPTARFGVAAMRQRARLVGGQLTVRSARDHGATVAPSRPDAPSSDVLTA